jgi:catechol 2,3-dioxygenase
MTTGVRRLGHIGLIASNLEEMSAFYQDLLGFQLSDQHEFPESSPYREGVWLRCNTDHHVLSIFDLRDPANDGGAGDGQGLHHFAFEMESFAALRQTAKVVRERGLRIQGQRTGGPGNQLRFYFWDPEGNLIELYWYLDQIGWDGKVRDYPEITNIDIETFDIDAWIASKSPTVETSA